MTTPPTQLFSYLRERVVVYAPPGETLASLRDHNEHAASLLRLCQSGDDCEVVVKNEPGRTTVAFRYCFYWGFGPFKIDTHGNTPFPDQVDDFVIFRRIETGVYEDSRELHQAVMKVMVGQSAEFIKAFIRHIPFDQSIESAEEYNRRMQEIVDHHFPT